MKIMYLMNKKKSKFSPMLICSMAFVVLFIIVIVVSIKLSKRKNKEQNYNRMEEEEETSELIINYN